MAEYFVRVSFWRVFRTDWAYDEAALHWQISLSFDYRLVAATAVPKRPCGKEIVCLLYSMSMDRTALKRYRRSSQNGPGKAIARGPEIAVLLRRLLSKQNTAVLFRLEGPVYEHSAKLGLR
jgi:hypothetical protein